MSQLRAPFLVTGFYALAVGVVQLFPALAQSVFGRPVVDPAVESLLGTSFILSGLVALVASSNPGRYAQLAWIFAFGLALGAVDVAYYWGVGEYAARTALVPILLNALLALWMGAMAMRAPRAAAAGSVSGS